MHAPGMSLLSSLLPNPVLHVARWERVWDTTVTPARCLVALMSQMSPQIVPARCCWAAPRGFHVTVHASHHPAVGTGGFGQGSFNNQWDFVSLWHRGTRGDRNGNSQLMEVPEGQNHVPHTAPVSPFVPVPPFVPPVTHTGVIFHLRRRSSIRGIIEIPIKKKKKKAA